MADLANVAQIGGQAQYRPLDSRVSDWNAMTQNQRNYQESKAKNEEQRKLAEDLANINTLGLPKNIQADIQAKRDELVEKVRNGEVDPYSYDFLTEAKGVLGYGLKTKNDYTNAVQAAAAEGQIIELDENGNPVNRKQSYRDVILNPDLSVEEFQTVLPKIQTQTPALEIPIRDMQNWIVKYNSMNADQQESLTGSSFGTLTKETVSQLEPEKLEALYTTLEDMAGLSLDSKYADLNSRQQTGGLSLPEWKKQFLTSLLPQGQTTVSQQTDPMALAQMKINADLEKERMKKEGKEGENSFEVSTDTLVKGESDEIRKAIDTLFPKEGDENSDKRKEEVVKLFGDLGTDITKVKVAPKVKGKELSPITIKGTNGVLTTVYMSKDAKKGLAVINTFVDKTTSTGKGSNEKVRVQVPNYISLDEAEIDRLQKLYGVSFTGATPTPKESNNTSGGAMSEF